MMLENLIRKEIVGGKPTYWFEQHHYAIIPWHDLRQKYGQPLRLLTLDYHTDTMTAFRAYAGRQVGLLNCDGQHKWRQVSQQAVADIRIGDKDSIERAVARLKHDEHIDAALKANMLDLAFVIAIDNFNQPILSNEQAREPITIENGIDGKEIGISAPPGRALPPYTYTIPENGIIILEKKRDYSWLRCDEDGRSYKDAAIESSFLSERLDYIENICGTGGVAGLSDEPFILDIDLDYFNTKKSITPDDVTVFHNLIRDSVAITVARESGCVQSCQIQGENLTSDWLENELRRHIHTAMQSEGSA